MRRYSNKLDTVECHYNVVQYNMIAYFIAGIEAEY